MFHLRSLLYTLRLMLVLICAVHMPPLDGRLVQLWLYGRSHPDDNHYSHPIDIVVLVDLNLKKVIAHSLSRSML